MRKTASVFFLILFLFNLYGSYFVYNLLSYDNRSEMRSFTETSASSTLTDITIPVVLTETENTVFQQTGEDEIMYQGRMYDVARSEHTPDGLVHFYCVNDTREENLRTSFNQQILDQVTPSGKSEAGKPHKLALLDFLKDYVPVVKETPFAFTPTSLLHFSNYAIGYYPSLSPDIISPPPRIS
jgi:hypothetical protein